MTEVDLAIPVVQVGFSVEVLRRSALLPLDIALLRLIGDGVCKVAVLAEELGLTRRMIRSSTIRLIEEDLLSVNLSTEELQLSPRAMAAYGEGELTQLAYLGEPQRRRFRAIQELCWGTIIAGSGYLDGFRLGAPSRNAIHIAGDTIPRSILSLRSPEIAALYNERFLSATRFNRESMAVGGTLTDRAGSTALNLTLTAVKIENVLDLWPIEPSRIWQRSDVSAFLSRLRRHCRSMPELVGLYAEAGTRPSRKMLASPTRIVAAADMDARSQLEHLGQSLDSRGIADHEGTIHDLYDECHRIFHASCEMRLVLSSDHVVACKRMLNEARSFCVVHSAFWSDAGIRQYAEEIREALARGVSVFLLRGLGEPGEEDAARPPALDELEECAKSMPGSLLLSTTPHHSHAKLAVADTGHVIVSSFNFLGATAANPQLNTGIECRSATRAGSSVALAVLDNLTANGLAGEIVERLGEVLQSTRFSSSSRFVSEAESAQLAIEDILNPQDWFQTALNEVWKQERSPWELVTNEEHRDLLLRALHTAERSIVVASGDLTESAADRVFRDYLSAAVKRSVNVTILWGSQAANDEPEAPWSQAVSEIRAASKGKRDLVKFNEEPRPVHAKLLIIDDEVSIVTSFNFLSYRGTRSGAHELGMKIYNPALSAQLHEIVNNAMVD